MTPDRLHSAWIGGGARAFGIAAPGNPAEVRRYNPDETDAADYET